MLGAFMSLFLVGFFVSLSPQLSLGLELSDYAHLESFYPGKNTEVLQVLKDFSEDSAKELFMSGVNMVQESLTSFKECVKKRSRGGKALFMLL